MRQDLQSDLILFILVEKPRSQQEELMGKTLEETSSPFWPHTCSSVGREKKHTLIYLTLHSWKRLWLFLKLLNVKVWCLFSNGP